MLICFCPEDHFLFGRLTHSSTLANIYRFRSGCRRRKLPLYCGVLDNRGHAPRGAGYSIPLTAPSLKVRVVKQSFHLTGASQLAGENRDILLTGCQTVICILVVICSNPCSHGCASALLPQANGHC